MIYDWQLSNKQPQIESTPYRPVRIVRRSTHRQRDAWRVLGWLVLVNMAIWCGAVAGLLMWWRGW